MKRVKENVAFQELPKPRQVIFLKLHGTRSNEYHGDSNQKNGQKNVDDLEDRKTIC